MIADLRVRGQFWLRSPARSSKSKPKYIDIGVNDTVLEYMPLHLTEREEKLYFVRETKGTLDSQERRTKENQKIDCGRRHFEVLGTDLGVVTSLAEVQF